MQLSGHKSYQSFSVYLHKTDLGEKRACLILEKVDPLLTTLGTDEALKTKRTKNEATVYPLQNHRNEGLLRSVAS